MWALEGKGCQRYCGFQQSSGHLLEFPGFLKTQTSGPGAAFSALCRQWYLGYGLGSTMVKKQGKRWTGSGHICEKGRVVVGSEQET